MGTRGALCFVVGGAEKVIYNQFDSYPSGLGEEVATWLRGAISDEGAVRSAAAALTPVESGSIPTGDDIARFAEFHDPNVSNGSDWYSLLRRTQGSPELILKAGAYEPADHFPFDSLFCEWAYVVDFDSRTFEVYEGFRTQPPTTGRWVGRAAEARDGYFPVERVRCWPFDQLPEPARLAELESGEDD